MQWDRNIRPFGGSLLRWLPKAVLLGGIPSALAVACLDRPEPGPVLLASWVGAVCSLFMWGGYELLSPWILAHSRRLGPNQAALVCLGKWMLVYSFLATLFLVIFHRVLNLQISSGFTVFMGLVLSCLVVIVRNTSAQVAAARALEQARAEANLAALKSQLSPHTLFNALNAIAALIPTAPRDAERCVEHLGNLLRRTLAALERESWTLGEELALLGDLLALEKMRFGQRLSVEFAVPERDLAQPIPPLLLLPLVENSLKHGFRSKVGSCRLAIAVDGPRVRVVDDGVGRSAQAREGFGLRTVRQRLEVLGGGLEWLPAAAGCAVEVRLCP
jgi:hypothetical protein